jgi:hypothetical protein
MKAAFCRLALINARSSLSLDHRVGEPHRTTDAASGSKINRHADPSSIRQIDIDRNAAAIRLRIIADTTFGGPTHRADLLTKQLPFVDGHDHHSGVGGLWAGNGLDDGTKTPAVGRQSPDRDGPWSHDDGGHGRPGVSPRSIRRQATRLAHRGLDHPRRKKGRQSIPTGITARRRTATGDQSTEPRLHVDLFRVEAGKPYDSAGGIVDTDKQGSGETYLAVDHKGIGRPLQTTGPQTAAGHRHDRAAHRRCRSGWLVP